MAESNELMFKPGDKVIKNGDPTIYRIKSVFLVKPVYYEAIGELGNIEYLPEHKLSLLTNKYHDDIVKESEIYSLDNKDYSDEVNVFFESSESKANEHINTLRNITNQLNEMKALRREYAEQERELRRAKNELEIYELQNRLKEEGVGRYAK